LRRLLARARPSPREVGLLRGLARQARWAARSIARRREPSR
jgi:tRNA C32,U32 (ribose-2'-O)-methylase TrmJ